MNMPQYCIRMTCPKDCLDMAKPMFMNYVRLKGLLSKDKLTVKCDYTQKDRDLMYCVVQTKQSNNQYLIKGAAAFEVWMHHHWNKVPPVRLYMLLHPERRNEFKQMIDFTKADVVEITPEILDLKDS